ncbi:right-handed parallel beta-helix repeat-containing protein [Aegicerativicinus sediminis]|uniref:right-handed parallel beta-helix repeat-containing protein n=1 Tax=Aegicerativicinus sediminis TaxID=2893202 RepID=UPI001E6074B5|nr:GDSL-type esterase/lipase family protein [Aegicerativicinus sediminis]
MDLNQTISRYISFIIIIASVIACSFSLKSYSQSVYHFVEANTPQELAKALDKAQPGDSIQLVSGVYNMSERLFINNSGTPQNKIFLIGSKSGRTILDFSVLKEDGSSQGIVLKADNWVIKGLDIRKAGDNGLQIRGSNNKVEFCSFYECADTGLQLDDAASNNYILNCDSYFNADSKLENADGFGAKMNVGSGNVFEGCRAWNNLDDGWDGYLRGTDNIKTTYKNCWAIRNGYLKNDKIAKGDGNGFKTGGSDNKSKKHNATYLNCIAIENLNDGFDHNSNRGAVKIENCLAIHNGRNFAFSEKNGLEELNVQNSFSIGNLGKFYGETLLVKGNSWQENFSGTVPNISVNDLLNSRQADGNLPKVPGLEKLFQNTTTIFLVGDSTMADYSGNYDADIDYMKTRYPLMGWGQVFQKFMISDSIQKISNIIRGDSVNVDDRARGGRSTRTFFQEGRWRGVVDDLNKDDIVIIQFGHNDASEEKPERYVSIEGYKEFLRLFVSQTREKKAIPILLTPVARNYPWIEGRLENVHGDYPAAVKEIAKEMQVALIDLNQLSMDVFSSKGKDFVTTHYFMNLPAGKYEAYPNGQNDNTHFQSEGALAVSQIIFDALKNLQPQNLN